ncbi:DUF3466 family protein [Rheinheimera maricola]|uniref:DUF3466 family protein n=1 Tax=Rheinheimera maricola TaxID=2793282 RepID=A0ABS7X6P0_9GAMM|nr:DUF3466 family protein [Rheinheimera maricola]MBZ9610859.1 DUF3466 family protein [Rheinheimera maricola]
MKLTRISLALLPLLGLCSVQAAVYEVVKIGEVAEVKSTYAAAMNNAGDTVFNGAIKLQSQDNFGNSFTNYQYFNFPINLDAIDFDNEAVQALFTDEQLASVLNGNIDNDILSILLGSNPGSQPTGSALNFLAKDELAAQNIVMRDFTQPSRTNSEYLYDINNSGVAVGVATAPFSYDSFTPAATEAIPEPVARNVWTPALSYQLGTVVKDGQVSTLAAPYQELGGGYTVAKAISDTGIIAGFGSSGMTEANKTVVAAECTGAATPQVTCFNNSAIAGRYEKRAMTWQLQADGTAVFSQQFGFLGDKNTGTEFAGEGNNVVTYYSEANAVNNNGLVVGVSMYTDSDRIVRYQVGFSVFDAIYRQPHASIFVDGQVLPIVDPAEWFVLSRDAIGSAAVAVNNNDIIVGYARKTINSGIRSKMFYHDYSSGKTTFVDGFFASSTTVPRAINDNNQVVGQAEVIVGSTTSRRSHGFIYDITTDSFVDLNTQLSCNSPYNIVDATDINDDGDIFATAIVKQERRNLVGDVVLDAQGNPLLEDVAIAVKLEAVANGQAENCVTEENQYVRKGGSAGFVSLLLASMLLLRRRRKA